MNNYITLLSKHRSAIMGFAILWVMLFHLRVSVDFMPFTMFRKIGYGGVDIFLFLSGLGLYYSCSKENFNIREYYKKRFKRILPEFWIVLLVVFILQKDFSCQSFYTLICCSSTLGLWVWGMIPYVLWYISCILLFYAIYPQYYSLFKKYGIIVPLLCIGGGFIIMVSYALFCILFHNAENIGGETVYAYARIPIFFLGSIFGWMAKNDKKITFKAKHKIIVSVIASLLFIASIRAIMIYPSNILRVCSLFFIPFITLTPILCVVLAVFFNRFSIMDKIFAYIGGLSLELYMCHVYIFKQLNYFVDNYGQNMAIFIVVILSCISAWLLHVINKKCLQRLF